MAVRGTTSFERFFRNEHVRLFQALFAITGSRQEAEDISQDAFVRVWERWDRVERMQDPAGYLHRTAMNAFRDRYRRLRLGVGRAIRPIPTSDPFEAVSARDEATHVLAALAPRQRAAIVLTEGLGYSAEEAGRLLGIKAASVRALRFQARSALKHTSVEVIDG